MSDSRVILITGSSSGIGRAAAHLFARKGYRVAVHGSNQEKINKVVEECNNLAPTKEHKSIGFVNDFYKPHTDLLVEQIKNQFGRLDALVVNAGTVTSTKLTSEDCFDNYKKTQTLNADSHIRVILAAIPLLKKATNPSITMMSSVSEQPVPGCCGYYILYSAFRSMAQSLAVDLAPHIRVNAISMGAIYTEPYMSIGMTENDYLDYFLLKRYGKVEEIAYNIYHLAHEATYCTGANLKVDGGLTLCEFESNKSLCGKGKKPE